MGSVYAIIWLVIAVVLFVRFRNVSPAIIPLSAYFVFLGLWWGANEFVQADLMNGAYGWILKGVSAAVLLFCGIIYYLTRSRLSSDAEDNDGEE